MKLEELSVGQKVHPVGFRLGTVKTWDSKWYANKEYAEKLHEDLRIRSFLEKKLKNAQVSKILIERAVNKAKVFVYSASPVFIIGSEALVSRISCVTSVRRSTLRSS